MIGNYIKNSSTDLFNGFNSNDFDCKCDYKDCQTTVIDDHLVDILQFIKVRFNAPIYITSAYRCDSHNKSIGGVKGSQHTQGRAIDIAVKGILANDVQEFLINSQHLLNIMVGRYNMFTHVDTRGTTGVFDKRRGNG